MAFTITRRKLFFPACASFLWVLYLTLTFNTLDPSIPSSLPKAHHVGFSTNNATKGSKPGEAAENPDGWIPPSAVDHFAKARLLLPSILNPSDTSIDRMTCPSINETRYGYMRPNATDSQSAQRKYIFALNLRQVVNLLPRLLGSVIEAITFLGPEQCALSIVEGNSNDGTLEVLRLLEEPLVALGVPYWLTTSPLNPSASDRIKKLAILRSLALESLTGPPSQLILEAETVDPDGRIEEKQPNTYWAVPSGPADLLSSSLAPGATVLFINDVAACAEDLLELVHQRVHQGADMVCAMDWMHSGTEPASYTDDNEPFFYDVWIARGIDGDLFFDIPAETVSWKGAKNLFPNNAVAKARMDAGLPFQVFACWNGAVAFSAAPVAKQEVGFRWSQGKECFAGEAELFCKDMWFKGHGKIAVVPSVNLQYTDERGRQLKRQKGYVSDFVSGKKGKKSEEEGVRIAWKGPPDQVKCMPTFNDQSWVPWNESLVGSEKQEEV